MRVSPFLLITKSDLTKQRMRLLPEVTYNCITKRNRNHTSSVIATNILTYQKSNNFYSSLYVQLRSLSHPSPNIRGPYKTRK